MDRVVISQRDAEYGSLVTKEREAFMERVGAQAESEDKWSVPPRKYTVSLSGFRRRRLGLFLNLGSGGQLSRVGVGLP